MSAAYVVGLLVMGAVEVSLTTLEGERHTGELIELSRDAIVIESAGTEFRHDVSDVLGVVPEVDPVQPPPLFAKVKLVDNSVLFLTQFQIERGQVSGQVSSPGDISLRRKDVSWIRWLDHEPRLDGDNAKSVQLQWDAACTMDVASDRIVIRRQLGADRTQRISLNRLSGVVHDVTNEFVRFEFSGRRLDVPRRDKIEGLILYHPRSNPVPAPVCSLTDVSGSEIQVRSLVVQDDVVKCRTVVGSEIAMRWASIRHIDFSQGKIVFLSEMEPERIEWMPFLSAGPGQELLSRLYAPRRDQNFDGKGLRLRIDGKTRNFDKGLALHSRTDLVYRIDGQFRRFVAWAGIDPDLGDQGDVRLVILGDSQQLFESNVSGAGGPVALDIDVSGVRRLRILVDFGNDLDVADHLYLCDSKVTK